MIVLDTSVAIAHLRDHPAATRLLDDARSVGPIVLPAIAAWELWKGSHRHPTGVTAFLSQVDVEAFDGLLAHRAARLYRQLAATGISVPTLDLLIAVHAMARDAPLATLDAGFARIPGLRIVRPRSAS